MKQWKEELINAKEEIIYVKHERGDGATTTILNKILNSDKDLNVLYYGVRSWGKRHLELIRENKKLMDLIDTYNSINEGSINKFVLKNGSTIKIYYSIEDKIRVSNNNELRGITFDMGVSDGLHFSIPNMLLDCKQKIVVLADHETYPSILIDSQKDRKKKSFDELIQEENMKLAIELLQANHSNNTALYRKSLVEMIEKLHNLHKEVK